MKINKSRSILFLILSVIIGAIVSIGIFTNKGFSFHDETQIAYLSEYVKVINLGQFPPRWAPDMQFTYGSPYLEFNYQLPYYVGYIFHRIGFSLLDSYKLILASSFIIGSLGMYLLASLFVSPVIAFCASTLFTLTPYRAVDVFVRGTIGEAYGIALFPWVIWSIFLLRRKPSLNNILLVGLSTSALLLSHQPAAVLGLPLIALIFLISELMAKNYKFLGRLFVGFVFAGLLSAFYFFPALLEQIFIKPLSPFNFYDHFPFIKQLIYSKWGYGVSIEGPYDGMSFQLGFANIAILLFGLIALFIKPKNKTFNSRIYIFSTLTASVIALYLMNIRSSWFWYIFPFTNLIQFPWRILSVMAILTSLMFVFVASSLPQKFQKIFALLIVATAVINCFGYFHPGTIIEHNDNYYLRRYLPNQVLYPGEKVSADYLNFTEESIPLPANAVRPKDVPLAKITSVTGLSTAEVVDSDPFHTILQISNSSDDRYTVHNFYYPGWQVVADGKIISLFLDKNGAFTFYLSKGTHSVTVEYLNTPIRYISNLISLFMWVGISGYFVNQLLKKRVH